MSSDERRIPYDCEQINSKLKPIVGRARRLFVRSETTGVVSEVVGVETRQVCPARPDGPLFEEDVYLVVRVVKPLYLEADDPEGAA